MPSAIPSIAPMTEAILQAFDSSKRPPQALQMKNFLLSRDGSRSHQTKPTEPPQCGQAFLACVVVPGLVTMARSLAHCETAAYSVARRRFESLALPLTDFACGSGTTSGPGAAAGAGAIAEVTDWRSPERESAATPAPTVAAARTARIQ